MKRSGRCLKWSKGRKKCLLRAPSLTKRQRAMRVPGASRPGRLTSRKLTGVRKRRTGRKCVAYSKTTHKCLRYAHPGANRDAARGYAKLRGVGRCKRWSKGRTRCLKRA